MRNQITAALFVFVATAALVAFATDEWVGTIYSLDAGSFNNTNTRRPDAGVDGGFYLSGPSKYTVQCTSRVTTVQTGCGQGAGVTQTTTALYGTGMEIGQEPGAPYDVYFNCTSPVIAIRPDSGVGNCRVYRSYP